MEYRTLRIAGIILFFLGAATFGAERIYSSASAATALILRMGGGAKLAAIDAFGKNVPGTENIPVAGRGGTVFAETAIALKIDHAIVWRYQVRAAEFFRRRNIPVTQLDAGGLSAHPELIGLMASLCGRPREAGQMLRDFEQFIAAARKRAAGRPRKRVYCEFYTPWRSAGSSSYAGELIELAGGRLPNPKTALLNPETIIAFAPEIILYCPEVTSREALLARPGMSLPPAAATGGIHAVPRKFFIEGTDPKLAVTYLERIIQCHSTK